MDWGDNCKSGPAPLVSATTPTRTRHYLQPKHHQHFDMFVATTARDRQIYVVSTDAAMSLYGIREHGC